MRQFAKLFKDLADTLEAAKVQGFAWNELTYEFEHERGNTYVALALDENVYLILALRYKELFGTREVNPDCDLPYDVCSYLTEIDTGRIDVEYMNANFDKWLKRLASGGCGPEDLASMLDELHASFASLDQEQQRYASLVIQAAQSFDLVVRPGMTFMDYVVEFQARGKADQLQSLKRAVGVDVSKVEAIMAQDVTESNINEFKRFDDLMATADMKRARSYFEAVEGTTIPPFKVRIRVDKLLREFILSGGFDIE